MPTVSTISTERARAAARLVGEVHEIGPCTEAGRRHLLTGIVELVGASVGAVAHDARFVVGGKGGIRGATLVNFDGQARLAFETHDLHGASVNPYHRAVQARLPQGTPTIETHSSDDIVPAEKWRASPWVNEYLRPARLDHFLGSERLLGRGRAVLFGFVRGARDRPFSYEDRELVHLVHLGIGHVFDPCPVRDQLPPRARAALDCLLAGATDKEIAAQLGLSPHTARDYVKSIYRAYGISSRAQLIARCARRRS